MNKDFKTMFTKRYICLFFIITPFLISIIFSKDISLKYRDNFKSTLEIKNINKIKVIESISTEHFPVTSTFYQLSEGMDIQAYSSYQEGSSEIIDQSVENILISSGYEIGENSIFPKNNLIVSDPQVFRGLVVRQITFIPFTYIMETKEFSISIVDHSMVEQVSLSSCAYER